MAAASAYASMNTDDHGFLESIGAELAATLSTSPVDQFRANRALQLLKSSMLLHFSQEEALMRRHNYPDFFHHKFSHDYIVTNLTVFISSFTMGHEGASAHMWPALKTSLDTHITRYDDALSSYLDGRG